MAWTKNSIIVNLPPSRVFAYVNDPNNLPDWMPGMIEVRNLSGFGEGQQYDWTYKMLGFRFRGQSVVVEYEPGTRAVHQSIGMISSDWTITVEPHEEGTKLTTEAEYSIPVVVLGKLAENIAARWNDRDMQAALLNVKEMMENRHDPAGLGSDEHTRDRRGV